MAESPNLAVVSKFIIDLFSTENHKKWSPNYMLLPCTLQKNCYNCYFQAGHWPPQHSLSWKHLLTTWLTTSVNWYLSLLFSLLLYVMCGS